MVVAWTEGVKRAEAKKLTVDCRLESAKCANKTFVLNGHKVNKTQIKFQTFHFFETAQV